MAVYESGYFQYGSYQERSWTELYEALKNRRKPLIPEELYELALAAYLTGKDKESIDTLSLAHHEFLKNKNIRQSIRCAFWIGMQHTIKGEPARGSGWFLKAQRLVEEHQYEGSENGLLLIPAGLSCLGAGNAEMALVHFKKAYQAAKGNDDGELMTLSLLGQGQAMIQMGNISEGKGLLDESMVTIESGLVSPIAVGIVYCAVIETCLTVFDVGRALEWTAVLSDWCESQPDIVPFRGQCSVRRSQIMHLHGKWSEALDEMEQAVRLLSKPPGEPAAGQAYYLLGEIFRLRGDFQQAGKLYIEANKWRRKPQPGLALLRLAQNEKELALNSVQSALDEAKTPEHRIKIIPAYIEILLACDKIKEAHLALDELNTTARKYDTIYLRAITAYWQGALLLKKNKPDQAIKALCKSLGCWNNLSAPYQASITRLLLGLAYRDQGDQDTAIMELTAARWTFKELKAFPDLQKADALLAIKEKPDHYGLTGRELEILPLIAKGGTNKIIARKLSISERTVERHLSNIFNKLQVNSRTEATAFAYTHHLF